MVLALIRSTALRMDTSPMATHNILETHHDFTSLPTGPCLHLRSRFTNARGSSRSLSWFWLLIWRSLLFAVTITHFEGTHWSCFGTNPRRQRFFLRLTTGACFLYFQYCRVEKGYSSPNCFRGGPVLLFGIPGYDQLGLLRAQGYCFRVQHGQCIPEPEWRQPPRPQEARWKRTGQPFPCDDTFCWQRDLLAVIELGELQRLRGPDLGHEPDAAANRDMGNARGLYRIC